MWQKKKKLPRDTPSTPAAISLDNDVDDTIYDETFEETEDALPKYDPTNFAEEL